jgi:hypothetical protein
MPRESILSDTKRTMVAGREQKTATQTMKNTFAQLPHRRLGTWREGGSHSIVVDVSKAG